MTNFRNLNLEPFSNINDLYLAYKHDPFNEEVTVHFFEMMGQLANCMPLYFPQEKMSLTTLVISTSLCMSLP